MNKTIYINVDGRIDPPTAPVSSDNNVTYTLSNRIMKSISGSALVVEKDNIIVDARAYPSGA